MTSAPVKLSSMLYICLAACTVGLVVVGWPSDPEQGRSAFTPEAYLKIVNKLFVANGWLLYTEPPAAANGKGTSIEAQIVLTNERVRKYYDVSNLRHDVSQLRLWHYPNGVLTGLDRSYYTLGLPSARRRSWEGDILFDKDIPVTRELQRADGGTAIMLAESPADRAPVRRDVPIFDTAGIVQGDVLQLHDGTDGSPTVVVLRMIGGTPVVESRNVSRVKVSINGTEIKSDDLRAIPPSGVLQFTGGQRTATFLRSEGQPEIGQPSLFHRWAPRTRNSAYGDIAAPLERALNGFVATDPGDESSRTTVRLSIDPQLNSTVQKELADFLRDYPQPRDKDFIAGITVMDAKTGALLAMASQSQPTAAQALRARIDDLNVNFRRLPVGSVAKVPFAAAILDRNPEFASLTIQAPAGGSDIKVLLGTELSSPLHDDGALRYAGQLDFPHFIAVSSDKYAAALLLLASVPHVPHASIPTLEPYGLDGQLRATRGLSVYERIKDGQPEFHSADDNPTSVFNWDDAMHEMFDIDYDRPVAGQAFNLSIWQPVFSAVPRASPSAFGEASPEQESFLMNQQRDFRQQAVSMILGSGDARWTNIKLAQTFARLVTGKTISAWLGRTNNGTAVSPAPMPMRDATRSLITNSMSMVVTDPAGTANKAFAAHLKPAAEHACALGMTLGVFGKTGTPKYENQTFTAVSLAISSLIHLHRVRLVGGVLVLSPHAEGELAIVRANRAALIDALRDDDEAAGAISVTHATTASVVGRLLRDNAHPEYLAERYWIQNNILITMSHPDRTSNHEGRAMVFVAALYPGNVGRGAFGLAKDAMAAPLSAISVAINFSDKLVEKGPHIGAMMAARIFRNIVVPRLLPSPQRARCT